MASCRRARGGGGGGWGEGGWLKIIVSRELKKNLRGRRRRQTVKIFRHNPCVFLSTYLLWLHCLFLFSLKFNWLQRVFLNEKIDDNCWNIDHVLQRTWKLSNWRLTRELDGTNVSLISHIHLRFLSCIISFIVLPKLPSPSSTVFLKFPSKSIGKRSGWRREWCVEVFNIPTSTFSCYKLILYSLRRHRSTGSVTGTSISLYSFNTQLIITKLNQMIVMCSLRSTESPVNVLVTIVGSLSKWGRWRQYR